ncbi:dienelactone hydrolase family protein [Aquabacterium humicola]|uniref:dienelactone hydrolase family protein n=1 Tax=Aquabacterium humicola TaxID=3237377 RepID=UPI0025438160|nr:dienelactone hydrolase family protein [Rubrivivax pictus]
MSLPVHSEWIEIEPGFAAHLTLPPAGSGPGLLVLQEIFGVNDHIRAVARQYAMDGFVVLAPDVFWRQSPRIELGYEGHDRQRGVELAGQLQPAEVVADLQAAATALRGRAETAGRKIGAIGYCMGGRLAYAAAALAGVDAAVAYYGGGIQNQLDLAGRITCPVQFHYAGRDDHIPPAAVDKVRAAMAGKPHEIHVYPDAMHGFNCWARASYDAPSAALAHGRSLQFLTQLF